MPLVEKKRKLSHPALPSHYPDFCFLLQGATVKEGNGNRSIANLQH